MSLNPSHLKWGSRAKRDEPVRVTVSEDGLTSGLNGAVECHRVEDVDWSRMYGERSASVASIRMTAPEAVGVAVDLLMQLVDRGVIAGWNLQYPERP